MVTVIVPVFNKSAYIANSIRSVLAQTYSDFELLLIDDGSTDNSREVIESIILGDERCQYVFQQNQGVSAARNYGVKLARGQYITFLDADDEYDPQFIAKMLAAIKEGDVAYCAHNIAHGELRMKARFEFFDHDLLYGYLSNRCTPNTNSWLIRREFVLAQNIQFKVGVSWGEDMMFFSELIAKSKQTYPCKEYLTVYHMGVADSLSVNSMDKVSEDIRWMSSVKDLIVQSDLSARYKDQCINVIDHYRLPAGVVYRLMANASLLSRAEYVRVFAELSSYLKMINLVNGLRSLKLYVLFNILRAKYFLDVVALKI